MIERVWYEPTDKWPIEPIDSDTIEDIRETVRRVAQTEALLVELRELYQTYPPMKELQQALDESVKLELTIQSSRKYTRYKFFRVRGLDLCIKALLLKHGLQCDTRIYPEYMPMCELTTLRIGGTFENIIYTGEPCDVQKT